MYQINDALSGLEGVVVTLGTSPLTLIIVVALCWLDGFFPPVPSEAVVIAVASALVGSGGHPGDIALLVVAAAVGAFVGDLTAYAIGSRFRLERWRVFRTRRGHDALNGARATLARRGSSYILAGRFVPIGRVFINTAAGATGYSRATFASLTAVSAVVWGVYATLLGVGAGHVLRDEPLLAAVAGAVIGVGMGLLVDRLLRTVQAFRRTRPSATDPTPRAMLSAHRGAARQTGSRENSWESLTAAVEMPVDYVEFDLHRTSDGKFVLHHGRRVWGADGRHHQIRTTTYGDLLEVATHPLPRYRDALELIRAKGKRAHIDLKFVDVSGSLQAAEITAAEVALQVMGHSSAFLITTLADRSVRVVREWADARSPDTLVGLSIALHRWPSALYPGRRLARCGANLIAVDYRIGGSRLLAWAHQRHIPVLLWTVDKRRTLRRLQADPQVWMVATNHPSRALVRAEQVELPDRSNRFEEALPVLAA